jgi:hypothetical protein
MCDLVSKLVYRDERGENAAVRADGMPRGGRLSRATRRRAGDRGNSPAGRGSWSATTLRAMRDEDAKLGERLEASRLLAVRGWGKAGRTSSRTTTPSG